MERIYRSVLKLMDALTLEDVCKRAVEEGCRLVDAKQGSIFWHENGKLKKVYTNVPKKEQLEPRPGGNVLAVFNARKPRFLSLETIQQGHPHFQNMPVRSITLIPLSYANKSLGVMSLQSEHEANHVTKQKQRLLLFGSFISLVIRNVQLFQQKENALKQRDLFMSLASHELKTPLAVIIMTMHLVERKIKNGKLNDQEWMETIKRNAAKLKFLIDDLFSVSQMNAKTIKILPATFSLVELSKSIINELNLIYPQDVQIIHKLDAESQLIRADKEKITSVLSNIIGNAAKFSDRNSKIIVSIKNKWSGIEVSIKDQGVGISEADQKKVFDRYFQGKNRGNGLGLGLFLSKEIIEAHDGEINLHSVKGKGTTVVFWLPRN